MTQTTATASLSSPVIRPPTRFLLEQTRLLPRGKALDVAAGTGRNTLFLAEAGFAVHAVDRDRDALKTLSSVARERGLSTITVEELDLESPENPILPALLFPAAAYDVVVVFFYLFRPLFPALLHTLKPGGTLLYETFLAENYLRYQRPRHREFCLEPGELPDLAQGLEILHYDESERPGKDGGPVTFTARLLARKPESAKGDHGKK
ncbi:MAG: methyltransferase domain-containing protein [Deltaproteobacteria bacterium]|nr:methyltransferase domain-containing protein [Deltaproteobacteria bacterium]